jgi:enoyl-CoA hydratase
MTARGASQQGAELLMDASVSQEDVLIRRRDRAGRITMNRPTMGNSLSLGMVRAMTQGLHAWRDDPAIELVVLDGAGDESLCGGSDLATLCKGPSPDAEFARVYWRATATLASVVARYPKPIVAIMNGLVAGSGIGLAAHATYRVVTERSRLALPETTIGLVPDMGASWLLARAPGQLGLYLGTTGQVVEAADAILAGLADGAIRAERLPELVDRLANPFGGPPERILNGLGEEPAPGPLAARQAEIDAAFGHAQIERSIEALAHSDSAWAKQTAASLANRSPLCLKLTWALVRKVRTLRTLEEALVFEYRLTNRLFEHGELNEGVRARLIETNGTPRWSPASLAEIDDDMVASFFAQMLPGDDLKLA